MKEIYEYECSSDDKLLLSDVINIRQRQIFLIFVCYSSFPIDPIKLNIII